MAGTKAGGIKARNKNYELYGKDFYRNLGAMGGKVGKTGGFASELVGKDGLTGPQRASLGGAVGGRISTRLGVKNKPKV